MSFFKDFKDDLSLVVNELLPGEDAENEEEMEGTPEMMVNTLEGELDIESELSKLDGLLEHVEEKKEEMKRAQMESEEPVLEELPALEPEPAQAPVRQEAKTTLQPEAKQPVRPEAEDTVKTAESFGNILDFETAGRDREEGHFTFDLQPEESVPQKETEPAIQSGFHNNMQTSTRIKEELPMNEEMKETAAVTMEADLAADTPEITDEVSIITDGTNIKGNLSTTGSFSISGRVEGNVQCNGKLEVTGIIKGNSSSSEVFSDAAKIEGEIVSTGTVKIGLGSVVVGNISATSAVIAGAVKGDIDVQGPVVVDTSAVIVGNIKSRSVQINNGAVIEGFCSQCYADIDVESLFGDSNKKGR